MYGNGCGVDDDPVDWAIGQLDMIANSHPRATTFMRYIKDVWRPKTSMWCVGARRIPHVGQNTNAAIESYHSNLKSILHAAKERFVGRRMDWLIYHLTGDVLTHYWYNVQCKTFGFVRNRKQEFIVVSAIIRANEIPDTNVLICMDEGVAYVASVNNRPKVWTIHAPDSEWAQCNCPVAKEGMICKHTVKVFKMLHPNVDDGTMVLEAGTKHGVDRATPMSQSFTNLSQHSIHIQTASGAATDANVVDVLQDTTIHVGSSDVHITSDPTGTIPASQDQLCTLSPIVVGEASNTLIPPQSNSSQTAAATTSTHIYKSLVKKAAEYPILQDYLLADLKFIRGKQDQLISRGIATMQVSPTSFSFPERLGDNSLKRHRSFLESPLARKKISKNS